MNREHLNEVKGIIVFALGVILLASLVSFVPDDLAWYTTHPNSPAKNLIRVVGAYSAGTLFFVFGYSVYFLVVFLFFWSWNKFASREIKFTAAKAISFLILFSVISALFSMAGPQEAFARFSRGGFVGYTCADFLVNYLGRMGAYVILTAVGALTFVITGELLVSPLLFKTTSSLKDLAAQMREGIKNRDIDKKESSSALRVRPAVVPDKKKLFEFPKLKLPVAVANKDNAQNAGGKEELQKALAGTKPTADATTNVKPVDPPKPNIKILKGDDKPVAPLPEPQIIGEYHLPSLELLNNPPIVPANRLQSDLAQGAKILESTLADFNVNARVADIEHGPVITRYELEPAPGVKVQKITSLADDIALAMKAQTVRIVAPIPGKNRVGIEVPNSSSAAVYLKDVLAQSQFSNSGSKLMLALGKDITGSPLIADLAEMPHLLIAGTTGSGKTVCVNAIIMSMLFNATPDELKFLMVDPKMVELSQYNDMPHMLCPAVTDTSKVPAALNWVVGEMEARYQTLSKAGVRNIKGYHAQGHKLPYIVLIIDELADLMQTSAKTVESAITRLAQLSRAVGIHLILATQRPSVDVITGVIKANFPSRISFKVASKVDSRTVLDMNGAENLLGKGDLLFIRPGDAKPIRGQCGFVTDDEVKRVIDFIKPQQQPVYNDKILIQQKAATGSENAMDDELYEEALRLVIEINQASVSILQRRMRLGYTRAARLIDIMEQNGIVGPYCGSKPRDILVNREEWLMRNSNSKDNT
ncbi:MAG: DNA translocase FtsK [Candidatus Omnitrophica bacterium]|nr:DNA translocase FtsK [Candidatus Omnitrophota bacterium]